MNHVDNPFQSPAVLSLCPGILGLDRGVERAIGKVRVLAYAEIEAFLCANLIAGMETGFLDPAPVWTDLTTFPAHLFRGKVHGIIGGYPCQPFSNAGKRAGADDHRHLWPHIRRIIAETNPCWCFFENVYGHLSLGFDIVHRELSAMGFAVEAGIYTAQEVGAPHERKRLFILAIKRELADTESVKGWLSEVARQKRTDTQRRCTELGDSESISKRKPANQTIPLTASGVERCEFGLPGYELAYGNASTNLWPAGQGFYQHPWEAPRTIEPGLGCTIDGYNFREDLLRAFGNAVVEQTAELAFIDLLNKHFQHQPTN